MEFIGGEAPGLVGLVDLAPSFIRHGSTISSHGSVRVA